MKKLIRFLGRIYSKNPKRWHFWNPLAGPVGAALLMVPLCITANLVNMPTLAVLGLIYAIFSPILVCIVTCANHALDKISTSNTNNNS